MYDHLRLPEGLAYVPFQIYTGLYFYKMPDCVTIALIRCKEGIIYTRTIFALVYWATRLQIKNIWLSKGRRSSTYVINDTLEPKNDRLKRTDIFFHMILVVPIKSYFGSFWSFVFRLLLSGWQNSGVLSSA